MTVILSIGEIMSNQQSGSLWYDRSQRARTSSGFSVTMFLTVFRVSLLQAQSPTAAMLNWVEIALLWVLWVWEINKIRTNNKIRTTTKVLIISLDHYNIAWVYPDMNFTYVLLTNDWFNIYWTPDRSSGRKLKSSLDYGLIGLSILD
jgi:hypothetical protein